MNLIFASLKKLKKHGIHFFFCKPKKLKTHESNFYEAVKLSKDPIFGQKSVKGHINTHYIHTKGSF